MAEIQVLDKHVAELIAAGEVIDRPASVVKELVENSIDAGATAVTVELKNGGVTFIRVTDDGCGIEADQVPTAFLRHATSKVQAAEDLEQITTLGFRGEALASICAVSKVEIFTRTAEELAGVHLQNSGGEVLLTEDAGCAVGTTIVVRDLFFNTPARLKFLKTDAVEGAAVGTVMDNIALSHPELSVRFIKDGKETLHTPGDGKLKSAVYAVFGKEFTAGLLPVDYTLDHVRVWGFVSKPTAARPNRRMQHFFLNGRYVKCKTAMVAMEQAFKTSIMVGKFPACVLHLEVNCRAVDVNVHPTKLEVRFVNERPIFDGVYHAVKTALQTEDTPPVMTFRGPKATTFAKDDNVSQMTFVPKEPPAVPSGEKSPDKRCKSAQSAPSWRIWEAKPATQNAVFRDSGQTFAQRANGGTKAPLERAKREPEIAASVQVTKEAPDIVPEEKVLPKARLIGELFQTYMVVERDDDTALLIDKHAAHERLLYEKLKDERGESCAQVLLEPVTVTLQKEEYRLVLENQDVFSSAGFALEDFGEGTLLVRSAPLFLEGADIGSTVLEMAGYLCSHKTDLSSEHLDWLYHNIACRAAIKAGNHTSAQELIALANRLEQNPDVRYCPHGRPISIVLRKRDLEKQFGRIT
ncbi:MAG: DNA mismatch repair endonuclease MutL [Oscillospiraceae bacterium]|nr:DNA mismatch repair endonuclease MutL [Oscillospiraceae bacterium]